VRNLSGGELQRVALVLALGKPADIYLIDEPSAYLDSEQRIVAAKVIKRFILHAKKCAFVVEHDFIMSTYLADRVVVYTGRPGIDTVAKTPQSLKTGMNEFLRGLDITFRRDPTNFRPRINKANSVKDQEQKKAGTYFYIDDDGEDSDDDTGGRRKKGRKKKRSKVDAAPVQTRPKTGRKKKGRKKKSSGA
jgi:ATP-binding cassette subfamily E protein 1